MEALQLRNGGFGLSRLHMVSFIRSSSQIATFGFPSYCNGGFSTHRRRNLSIRAATNLAKKKEIVNAFTKRLETTYLIAGVNYKGFTVKHFEKLRSLLPDTAKLFVAKNNLLRIAVDGTPWEVLTPCMKGMNAWIFVFGEEIAPVFRVYRGFQKENGLQSNNLTCAVFEGKLHGPGDLSLLENMPSRSQLFSELLGLIGGRGNELVGTLLAPSMDLLMVLKAHEKNLEHGV